MVRGRSKVDLARYLHRGAVRNGWIRWCICVVVGAHVKSTYDALAVLELGAAYRDSPNGAAVSG